MSLPVKSRLRLMRVLFIALPIFVLAISPTAPAQPSPAATRVPSLRYGESTERHDLGTWDDLFVRSDQDTVLLRRESDLFGLSITESAKPTKLATAPALADAQIVACADSGERLWVFFNSHQRAPFAIDAHSGKMAEFEIPGLEISEKMSAGIQSHVIVRQADAAILMVSGQHLSRDRAGEHETWPREGNRPLYFWMSLKSGEVVAFPIGWDLDYFSADQQIAVFGKVHERQLERKAVDVRTGGSVTDIPDRRQPVVKFDWGNTDPVQPLYARRDKTGDADYVAGISVNGLVLPFDLGLDGQHYMSAAKANDTFAGFRLRRSGGWSGAPSPFWLTPLSPGQKPELVATGVTDFVLLGRGNAVFCSAGHGRKGLFSEAFFRNENEKNPWNVLDGVDRLPALDKEFMEKEYIEDTMSVRLIGAFGGDSRTRSTLCLFHHSRQDMRSSFDGTAREKRLKPMTWRRAVIVTTDGQRYMTDLFREGNLPGEIWFHDSGRVIAATHLWMSVGSRRERKLQLFEIALRLPDSLTEK